MPSIDRFSFIVGFISATILLVVLAQVWALLRKAFQPASGKPFFVAGPYDDVDAILGHLERTAGEGNYHYIFPIAGPGPTGRKDEDFDEMFAGTDDVEEVDNSSDVW